MVKPQEQAAPWEGYIPPNTDLAIPGLEVEQVDSPKKPRSTVKAVTPGDLSEAERLFDPGPEGKKEPLFPTEDAKEMHAIAERAKLLTKEKKKKTRQGLGHTGLLNADEPPEGIEDARRLRFP